MKIFVYILLNLVNFVSLYAKESLFVKSELVEVRDTFGQAGFSMAKSQLEQLEPFVEGITDTLSENSILPPVIADSISIDNLNLDSFSTDSLVQPSDSLGILSVTDSLAVDSTLEFPAFSVARDSIIEDFSDGKQLIYYYGDVKVDYGDMNIKAEYMKYDVDANIVYASGLPDSTGAIIGKPEMTENGTTYIMEDVYYNFASRKAKIKNMVTQQEEGFLHGRNIKKMPDNSINISDGKYTTCDCEHPHFYLKLTAAKVMTQPKQMTVFGPAFLVVEDVMVPVPIPFGFVPKMPTRASGILIPSYGEEISRGFFLKGLGYYFVIGDNWDIAATGDIYSLGSWAAQINSRYRKRYKYNGGFNLAYSNDQTGEGADLFQSKNFSVKWDHAQDPKFIPGTSFRASVNFSSPSSNQYNSNNSINDHLQNQISSSVSYSKTWIGTPFSLSVNMLHSQSSRDSSYAITFPNITFNMSNIYPLKKKESVGKEEWYETTSFSYGATIDNKINFKSNEFGEPDFLNKMKNGVKHNFNIGLPGFSLLKYLQFSPSMSYGMNWYFQDVEKVYNSEEEKIETIKSDQFSMLGASQDFSAGISMSTRLYGMFNFPKTSSIVAIRHMVSPSINLNFKPDMGILPINGFKTLTYVDSKGVEQTYEYNKYEGSLYSPPSQGKTAGLNFSLGNNLEAKLKDKNDTTGTGTKKLKLIDQLNLNGSYNFLADSMKLSKISVSMSTTLFNKLGLSGNMSLDPYAVDEQGRTIKEFNIVKEGGFKLARLTNASVTMSLSYQGGSGSDSSGKNSNSSSGYDKVYHHPVTGEYIPGGWLYYMDPSVPWSLNFNYIFSYNKSYQYANHQRNTIQNYGQTLGINGSLKLTKDLNFNLQTGFDLSKLKLTTTQLSASYDLHCFQISVSWVPIGQWQSWSFRINAKASALADLLQYKKNSSFWDNK